MLGSIDGNLFQPFGKLIVLICQCVLYFVIIYEESTSLGILYPIWSKLMETSVFPLVSSLRVFAGKSSSDPERLGLILTQIHVIQVLQVIQYIQVIQLLQVVQRIQGFM